MVITDRRLLWRANNGETISMWYPTVMRHRGFRKIATADLFVETTSGRPASDLGGRRGPLRFNGDKTFVFLCCRALSQHR
jgi:hypothetical protein